MILRKWEDLPENMKYDEVRYYYDLLSKRKVSLVFKRIFDVVAAIIMLVVLSPLFLILIIAIKIDSKGPAFYRQVRITTYGREFRIFKFRTMVQNADRGSQVTVKNDNRITRVGKYIRKLRLDELCQLFNVISGDMTFVGTRPEVPKYVGHYSRKMTATLLLPAGVTSEASIYYKDEDKLLDEADDTDKVYIEKVLPSKMYYNLKAIEKFTFFHELAVMFKTFLAVLGKEYTDENAAEEVLYGEKENSSSADKQ